MASRNKDRIKLTRAKDEAKAGLSNVLRPEHDSINQKPQSSLHDMLSKGVKHAGEGLGKTSQTKTRTMSKISPEMFDFSFESDDEIEKKSTPLSPTSSKTPLKEKNMQSLNRILPKELYNKVLSKHMNKGNSCEISPSVRTVKNRQVEADSEWENLHNTPHRLKTQTMSGKKKLLSKNAEPHFHSTPKESKDRSKQITSLLFRKVSQNLKSNDAENFQEMVSTCMGNEKITVCFDKNYVGADEDEFVEVQDRSVQTGLQPGDTQGETDDVNSYQEAQGLFSKVNSSETKSFDQTQDAGCKASVPAFESEQGMGNSSECSHSTQSYPDSSVSASSERCDEDSQSLNRCAAQSAVNSSQLQESVQSSPSFVEVQDASAMTSQPQDSSKLSQSFVDDTSVGTSQSQESVQCSPSCVEVQEASAMTSQPQDSSKSSQSFVGDTSVGTLQSQESVQSSQSFVEVQDTPVQVGSFSFKEQNEGPRLLHNTDQLNVSTSKLIDTDFEEVNKKKCNQFGSQLPSSEHQSRNESTSSRSNNSDHDSASSNSMYVSALQPESERLPDLCDPSQTSNASAFGSKKHELNVKIDNTSDINCSSSAVENKTSSISRCHRFMSSKDESSIFVSNTDSECSDTEEACDQPSMKIEASFSESSDCDEYNDQAQGREGFEIKRENEVVGETSKNLRMGDCHENSFTGIDTAVPLDLNGSNGCNSWNNGVTGDERSSPVSEISDMLKSTAISRRRKYSDSSDDDDAFEKFLTKMKVPDPAEEKTKLETSMGEFIDDEELSGENSSESSCTEDEVFHVRVDNIIDSKRKTRIRSSPLFEEDKTDDSIKSYPVLQLSSDDDDLFNDFTKDVEEFENPIKKSDTTHSLSYDMPHTPQAKSKSNDDDDDDFKTPFKTPQRPVKPLKAWERQFETPAAHRRQPLTGIGGERSCPMTVSRLNHQSRRSNIGLDDDAVFLKSLSEDYPDYKRHPEALRYIKKFKERRAHLTHRLFSIYNKFVFKEQLPANLEIEWSALYRKTAGTFCYRQLSKEAKITLSVKVCDRAERVRDTLAHELCHAAVRLINGVKESHGPVWKSWAQKVNRAFPFMPVIARCHDYIIATKYTYQCTKCNYRIGRHSKSLDTDNKVCGHCLGRFEVFLTRDLSSSDGGGTPATPRTPRTPNKFAMFVKESYAEVKKQDSSLKHADVMKILSQQFSEKTKISE